MKQKKYLRISKRFDKKKMFLPFVALLAIVFFATKGTDDRISGIQTKQVIQSSLISGQSTYEWPDGTKYTVEFKDGQPHGKGTIVFTTGQKYTGEFLYGQITSYGTMEYTGMGTYVGSFLNGTPNGKGTMSYFNGAVYSGTWVNGKRERSREMRTVLMSLWEVEIL